MTPEDVPADQIPVPTPQLPGAPGTVLPTPHKVAVLGFTDTRHQAWWGETDQEGVEIWGINNLHIAQDTPTDRCSRWFDLHQWPQLARDEKHVEWLSKQTRPVYLPTIRPEIPASVAFPADMLVEAFATTYFTNTISWLLALAGMEMQPALAKFKRFHELHRLQADLKLTDKAMEKLWSGYELDPAVAPPQPEVGVFGVDMAQDTEYGAQRPSCEYFIGVLLGAGFNVSIAPGSDLLKSAGLYGFADDNEFRMKVMQRIDEGERKMNALQSERGNIAQRLGELDGEIQRTRGGVASDMYWRDRWTQPQVDRGENSDGQGVPSS